MKETWDNPPTRRAAERRTRSNQAKEPRGSPASREKQQSIRLVTNAWTRVSKKTTILSVVTGTGVHTPEAPEATPLTNHFIRIASIIMSVSRPMHHPGLGSQLRE